MKEILALLALDDWKGISDEIEIAKGRNEYTTKTKEVIKQILRAKWQKRK